MDLGMPELLFIFGLALLIFGPAQLPKLGKQLGNALGEFKRASNEFKNQLQDEVNQLEFKQMQEEAKQAISLEPPPGTVAKGSAAAEEAVDFSKLSHDPAWEERGRTIKPPDATPKPAGDPVA
jgi:TatA/E family protein of Tat protein translocase